MLNIKEILKNKGLTQNDVAEVLQIDTSRFSRILKGKGDFTLKQFMELSKILTISPSELYNDSDQLKVETIKTEANTSLSRDLLGRIESVENSINDLKFSLDGIVTALDIMSKQQEMILGVVLKQGRKPNKVTVPVSAVEKDNIVAEVQDEHQKTRNRKQSK